MKEARRSDHDEAYARVWNAVRGGIRDFRNAHPDEIMPTGNREASLIKRIVGQIESLAERWCGDAPTGPGDTWDDRQPGHSNLGSGGAYGKAPPQPSTD